jgi:hypothetical protein
MEAASARQMLAFGCAAQGPGGEANCAWRSGQELACTLTGNGTRTDKLDERGALGVHGSLAESASSEHCDGWWLFEDVGCGGLVDSKWYFFATSGESSEGIGEEVGWRLEELALVETLDRGGGKKVCSFSRARQGMTWAWAWVSVRWYRETGKKSV